MNMLDVKMHLMTVGYLVIPFQYPRSYIRLPADISVISVYHSATADCSWRGN